MEINKRFELIKRNTVEIVNEDKIKNFMKKGVVYCGYECSGEIHLGHMVTILKLLDLQKAGIKVKVLLADWHTWLNQKGHWDFVNKQLKQWEKGFKSIGLKAEIIRGTSYQKKPDYFEDILKLALDITVNRGVRAMQQVARDIENAKISQIIYPLMQVTDVKFLKTNFVVAGSDQRKIYMLGVDEGKKIELQDVVYLYTPMIPSLRGASGKMSSSVKESFISIRDKKQDISAKVNKAYCPGRKIKDNPIVAIARLIIFPKFGELHVEGLEKKDTKTFKSYEEFEEVYRAGHVWPSDLKKAVADYLEKMIAPIRKSWK
ncbi:MAG: tyrosine--tRNA ligase [Nanoarchaeota archaeon]|nr:tyrosine--tRNA ligase [Nanoarchaeota archaeon]